MHLHMKYIRTCTCGKFSHVLSTVADSPEMFNVSVLPAVNSPLDVYFLFDLSASHTIDFASFLRIIEDISMSLSVFKNCMYMYVGTLLYIILYTVLSSLHAVLVMTFLSLTNS